MKPLYSQACKKLYCRIVELLMPHGDLNPNIDFMRNDASDQTFPAQFSRLSAKPIESKRGHYSNSPSFQVEPSIDSVDYSTVTKSQALDADYEDSLYL